MVYYNLQKNIISSDGKKMFGKTINDNPETYFTDEVLEKLDIAAKKEFMYGNEEESQ